MGTAAAERRVAMLRLARQLLAEPDFGTFRPQGGGLQRCSRSAVAVARRVAEAALQQPSGRELDAVVRAWSHLDAAAAGRHRNLRTQLQEIGRTLPRRLGLAGEGRPAVQDAQDLRYLCAYLHRLWPDGPLPQARPAATAGQPRREERPPVRPAAPRPAAVQEAVEEVELVERPRNQRARVRTSQGEEIPCDGVPVYGAEVGMRLKARVAREGSRAVRAAFRSWVR